MITRFPARCVWKFNIPKSMLNFRTLNGSRVSVTLNREEPQVGRLWPILWRESTNPGSGIVSALCSHYLGLESWIVREVHTPTSGCVMWSAFHSSRPKGKVHDRVGGWLTGSKGIWGSQLTHTTTHAKIFKRERERDEKGIIFMLMAVHRLFFWAHVFDI